MPAATGTLPGPPHDHPPGTSPLASWSLDTGFLHQALSRAATVDLVTIDLFDTALTRLVDSPADLFCAMEQRLSCQIGALAEGFALERETAERQARQAAHALRGAEEIDLEAILDRLPRRLSPFRDLIRTIELACEADTLVAVPDLLALTRSLAERGIRFAFVSDMYLPSAFLAERLAACGFRGWAGLHVSAETGATKGTGRQWGVLRALHGDGRILHIGDDRHADIDLPRTLGIDTLGYTRARSARRTALPFTPDGLPFSRARRAQVLRSRADPDAQPDADLFWGDLGRSWGAIVLAGFIRWLEAGVGRHRIDRLLFCARDGWLIRRAWQVSGAADRTRLAGDYLEVSRRPLNLACGWQNSTPERLDGALLGFLASSDGTVPVRVALARAGLDGIAPLRAELLDAFGSLDAALVWPDGTGRFEQVLARHSAAIHAALAPEHTGLSGYLRQSGLLDGGRVGLVDLGWHATMQRSLNTLIRGAGAGTVLHGFFYGLWPPARGNRFAAGAADSAFASDFEPAEEQVALADAVAMLEELHSAPHGTVLGYQEDGGGRWRAVHADDPVERAQFEQVAKPFGEGCLETVETLFRTGRAGALELDAITPAVVRATLGAITLSPQGEELERLGALGHHATFDHAVFRTLVPPGVPLDGAGREAALRMTGWRMGSAIRWMERAPPDQAQELRTWLRHMMRHYGERVLGRLG